MKWTVDLHILQLWVYIFTKTEIKKNMWVNDIKWFTNNRCWCHGLSLNIKCPCQHVRHSNKIIFFYSVFFFSIFVGGNHFAKFQFSLKKIWFQGLKLKKINIKGLKEGNNWSKPNWQRRFFFGQHVVIDNTSECRFSKDSLCM